MRRIDSVEDEMNDVVTYELPGGKQRVQVPGRLLREYGLVEVMRMYGVNDDGKRLPVFQRGMEIGTLPDMFEPQNIKSRSLLYSPRPGDFVRKGDRWEASGSMGLGDFESVPEFQRKRES